MPYKVQSIQSTGIQSTVMNTYHLATTHSTLYVASTNLSTFYCLALKTLHDAIIHAHLTYCPVIMSCASNKNILLEKRHSNHIKR